MKKIVIILLIIGLFLGFRYYQVKNLEYKVMYYICPQYENFKIIDRGFDFKTMNFYFEIFFIHKGIPFSGKSKYNPSIFRANWKDWEKWSK